MSSSASNTLALTPEVHTQRKPPSRKRERALQSAIVEFHRFSVVDPLSALLFAVPNGEKRDPVTAKILSGISTEMRLGLPEAEQLQPYGQGVLPGTTDLVLLTADEIDLIEVKTGTIARTDYSKRVSGGYQERLQKRFQAVAEALGHRYHIVRSVDDYEALLRARGVRLRATVWASGALGPPSG